MWFAFSFPEYWKLRLHTESEVASTLNSSNEQMLKRVCWLITARFVRHKHWKGVKPNGVNKMILHQVWTEVKKPKKQSIGFNSAGGNRLVLLMVLLLILFVHLDSLAERSGTKMKPISVLSKIPFKRSYFVIGGKPEQVLNESLKFYFLVKISKMFSDSFSWTYEKNL